MIWSVMVPVGSGLQKMAYLFHVGGVQKVINTALSFSVHINNPIYISLNVYKKHDNLLQNKNEWKWHCKELGHCWKEHY